MTIKDSILNDNTAKYCGKIDNDKILKYLNNENIGYESGAGGAIHNYKSKLTITGSTINKNIALCCSGAIEDYCGDLIITKSTINENIVKSNGGAVGTVRGKLIIIKSTINMDKTMGLNSTGGAIRSFKSEITIKESEFTNNSAKKGGALYLTDSKHELNHCTFKNNTPDDIYDE